MVRPRVAYLLQAQQFVLGTKVGMKALAAFAQDVGSL